MKFEVEFYETESGKVPIEEFLEKLDDKLRAKTVGLMEILEEKGTDMREPYSKYIDDGIFELRCKLGSNITRSLYFFYSGRKIIFTSAFVKKTQKTPQKEIDKATINNKISTELQIVTNFIFFILFLFFFI